MGPDRPRFDAAMGQVVGLAEGGQAAVGKAHLQRGEHAGMISLDREQVMRLVPVDQVRGQLALGQQGIAGDGLAGDRSWIELFEQRDDGADFVGLFQSAIVADGQGADFFGRPHRHGTPTFLGVYAAFRVLIRATSALIAWAASQRSTAR